MKEIQLFVSLYFIVFKIVLGLDLYNRCTDHSQCPTNSACRPYDCQGYTCLCDEGFVATDDKTKCLKGRLVGETCSFTDNICMSPFAFCLGHCECMGVFQPTEDGRCKLPGMGFTGDKCDELSPCHPPAACKNNKCVCEYPYRPLTSFEYWVDPMHPHQCVRESYSPDTCNGTAIAIPPALQPSTATTSTTTTTTESPITTEVITTKPTTKLTTTTEQPSTSTTSASTTTKATTTMIRTTQIAPTTQPLTTTKRPITTTHRPTTTTKGPTTTSKRLTTTTKRPTTTTKRPTTTTKRPTTTTKRPTTTTKRPTTTTKRPTTTTEKPTTTTKMPITTTNRPTTTTERPTKTTKRPTTTTKRSKTSTEKPTTITSISTTQNQAVNLSTAFDSNSFENEEIRTRNYSSIDKTLYESRQNKSHLNISNNRDLSDLTISDKIRIEGKESINSSIQLNTTNKLIGGSLLSSILPMHSSLLTTIYNVKPDSGEYIMPTLSYRSISTSFVSNEIAPTVTAGTDSLSDTRTQSEMYHEPALHSSTPRMSEGQTNGNISTTTASSEIHSMHKSSLAYDINVSPMSFSGVEIITTTPKEHIFRESVSNLHREPKNKSLEKKENPNSDSNFPTVPIFHIFSRTSESKKIIKSENLLNILKDTPAMEKTKSLMSGNTKSDIGSEEQKTTPVNRFSVNVATSVQTSEFQPITTQHTTTLFQPITTQKTMPLPPHLFVPRRPIVPIAVTLFDIGRELYLSCTQHSQCPEHAKCRPNACQGYLCLCDEGYIASEDRKFCLRAIRNGERCDPRTDKCLSKFSMCAGVCKCLEFFEHTRDGRCKLPNAGYLGDDCTKRGCQYPSKCVEGKCRCVHPFRKLTAEEFWVSPQSTLQCRMQEYSLDKCNGSYIQVPRDLRPNTTTQPQYTTDATLEILSYSPYIVDISTQSIEFLKDSKMALSSANSLISTALAANYSTSKQLRPLFSSYTIASALSSFSLPYLNLHTAESRMSTIQGLNNLKLERVSIPAKKNVLDNFSMDQSYTSIALVPLFDLMRSVLLNPNNPVTDDIDVKTEILSNQGYTRLSTSISNTDVASSIQFNNVINTRSEYYSVEDSLILSSSAPVVSVKGLSEQNDQKSNIYSEKSDTIDSQPIKLEGYDEKNSSIKSIMNSVFLSINDQFSPTYNARPTTGIYGLQSSFSSDFEVSVAKTKHRKIFGESSSANAKYNHDDWESVVVYSSSLSRPISTTGIVSNAYSSRPITFDISDHLATLPTMNMNLTKKLNDLKETSDLRNIFTAFSMKTSSYDKYLNMTSNSPTMNRSNEVSFKYYNYMTGTSVYNMHASDVLDSKQKSGASFLNEDRTSISMLGTHIELSHVSSANVKYTDVSELTSDENKTIYPSSVYLNRVKQSISLKRKEILSTKSVLYKYKSINHSIGAFSNQDTKIDTELHIESITTQTAYELNNTLSTYQLSREHINLKPLSTILKTVETQKGLNRDNVDLSFNSLRVVDSDELNISPSKTLVSLYQTFSKVSEESSPVVTMVTKTNSFQIDHITPLVVYDTDNKYFSINSTSTHPFLSFDGVNLTHNVLNSMSFQQKIYPSFLYSTSSKLSLRDDNVNAIVSSIFTNEQGKSLGTQTHIETFSHHPKSTLTTDLTHQLNDPTLAHTLSYDEVFPTELRPLFLHTSSDKLKQIDETDIIIQLHRTPNKAFDVKLINHTFKPIIQLSKPNTVNLINDSKLNVPSSHVMYTEFIEENDSNNFSPKSNVAIESYADGIHEPSLSTKMTSISQNTLPEVDPTASDKNMLTEANIKSAFTNTGMVTEANNIETKLLETSLETIVKNITSATAFGSTVNDSTKGFAFQNTITTALLPTFRSMIRETTFNFAVTDSNSKVTSQFEFQNTVAETLVSVLKNTPKPLQVSAFDAMATKAVPTFIFDNTITAESTVSIHENKMLQPTLPSTFGDTLLETSPIINKENKHTGIIFTHELRVITTEAQPISRLENKMIDASTSSSFEPKDEKTVPISTVDNTVLEASENLNAHKMWMNNILTSSLLDTYLKAKGTSVSTTWLTELATPLHTQPPDNFLTREQDKATFQLNSVFNLQTDIKYRLTTSIINEFAGLKSSSNEYFSKDLDSDRYSYTSPYSLYPSLINNGISSIHKSKEVLANPSEIVNLKKTIDSILIEPIMKYSDAELFVNLVPTTSQVMERQEDNMTRFKSRMTTNIPNETPTLPEADFPGEKPKPPEVIRSGIDQLILPISIVGVFLVNVIAAIIVLICRRKRRSDRARNLDEAKKRKLAEEQKQKHRFKIPRPNVHPPEYSNIIDNSSSDSSTYYNFLNTGFSTFHEENDTYEEIDKKVLKGSL